MCTCLDLDTVQFGGKLVVDCKHMSVLNFLGLWLFGENSLSGLPTGQRLQRSHQLPLRDVRLLLDLLHGGEIKFRAKMKEYPRQRREKQESETCMFALSLFLLRYCNILLCM